MLSPYATSQRVNPEERERLILEHLPQVSLIARRIHEKLPDSTNLEDLVSTGIVGLISAIDNYDRSQNTQLRTYAEHRIRGAILDSLRQADWAPRDRRRKAREVQTTIARLEQSLQRIPAEEEIAQELGVPVAEYREWLAEIHGLNVISLEQVSGNGETRDLLQCIPSGDEDLPSHILERSELEKLLAKAIDSLPRTEKTVLGLYYQEELTLKEIGDVMSLHPSRICQLKSQAVLRLRAFIEKRWSVGQSRAEQSLVRA